MKASSNDGKSIHHCLAEFLFEYRTTPHATANVAPNKLLLKRKLRTHFDLMMPSFKQQVTSKQADQKQHHDKHSRSQPMFQALLYLSENTMDHTSGYLAQSYRNWVQ